MHKPSSVLRLLLLIVLTSWIGIVTQFAEAQQTGTDQVLLEGKVVDNDGQPVPDAWVCAHLPTEGWWEGTCFFGTEADGGFQLRVLPAAYVVTVRPVFPLRQTRHRLEVSGAGVAALVLTVSRQPAPFVPDDPPQGRPHQYFCCRQRTGEVTLTGAAGAVAPQ